MDEQLQKRLAEQDAKLDAIYRSVEKTRKYMLVSIWITIIMIVLPIVGIVFIVPYIINSFLGSFGGLV